MTTRRYTLGITFRGAQDEARRRGDRSVGTEHLLLALLPDLPSGVVGVDVTEARTGLDELDRAALRAVGIDLASSVPTQGGPHARRLRLTPAAKAAIKASPAVAGGRRRLGAGHLLLALLSRPAPDPATSLLAHLGVDLAAVRARAGAVGPTVG